MSTTDAVEPPDLKVALKREREEHQHLLAESYAAVMDLTKQVLYLTWGQGLFSQTGLCSRIVNLVHAPNSSAACFWNSSREYTSIITANLCNVKVFLLECPWFASKSVCFSSSCGVDLLLLLLPAVPGESTNQLQIGERNWGREKLEMLERFSQERAQWEQKLREATAQQGKVWKEISCQEKY